MKRAAIVDPGLPTPCWVSPALCGRGAGGQAGAESRGYVLLWIAAEGHQGQWLETYAQETLDGMSLDQSLKLIMP